MVIDARAQEAGKAVHIGAFGGEFKQVAAQGDVIERRGNVAEIGALAYLRGNGAEKLVDGLDADGGQHAGAVGVGVRDIRQREGPF